MHRYAMAIFKIKIHFIYRSKLNSIVINNNRIKFIK